MPARMTRSLSSDILLDRMAADTAVAAHINTRETKEELLCA